MSMKDHLASITIAGPFVEDQRTQESLRVPDPAQLLIGKKVRYQGLLGGARIAGSEMQAGGARLPLPSSFHIYPHSPYGALIVPSYITLTHYNYSRYNLLKGVRNGQLQG